MDEVMIQEKNEVAVESAFSNLANFKELYDIGKMFASSSLVPSVYQGKPMDCMIAVDMANRMGVSPMMVMQNLYVVKGQPSWSGQACMSLIKASGEYKDVHHVYFGERNTNSWGCLCSSHKKKTGEEITGPEVTIQMAKDNGWFSKKDKFGNETSKWQSIPELMLAYRAAAFFARVHVPNSLMGCKVEGEVEDIQPSEAPKAVDPFTVPPADDAVMKEAEEVFG